MDAINSKLDLSMALDERSGKKKLNYIDYKVIQTTVIKIIKSITTNGDLVVALGTLPRP